MTPAFEANGVVSSIVDPCTRVIITNTTLMEKVCTYFKYLTLQKRQRGSNARIEVSWSSKTEHEV